VTFNLVWHIPSESPVEAIRRYSARIFGNEIRVSSSPMLSQQIKAKERLAKNSWHHPKAPNVSLKTWGPYRGDELYQGIQEKIYPSLLHHLVARFFIAKVDFLTTSHAVFGDRNDGITPER